MKKVFIGILLIIAIMTCSMTAFAASSAKYTGDGEVRYTVTTEKAEVLKLTPVKGKGYSTTNGTSLWSKNPTEDYYGVFEVSVNGKTYTVKDKTAKVSLDANSTYTVKIRYKGSYGTRGNGLAYGAFKSWKSYPGIKIAATKHTFTTKVKKG